MYDQPYFRSILVGPGNIATGLHLISYEFSKGLGIVPELNGRRKTMSGFQGLNI